jgi:hypothetical protein
LREGGGVGMTRDQTVALWLKCEKARARAISRGQSVLQAHEVAKLIWNDWARDLIHKRVLLEAAGKFKLGKCRYQTEEYIAPETLGENVHTAERLDESWVDFHGYIFKERSNFKYFIFPGFTIFGELKKEQTTEIFSLP